jgi:hypothetical protein
MNPEQQPDVSGNQPVAYDVQGRPLYYQPATETASSNTPSPELQQKHDMSVELYPDIQFAKTEYVVIDVQRTIWGLVLIWLVAIAAFIVVLLFAATMLMIAETDPFIMFVIVVTSGIVCLAGGAIGQYVFNQNSFIVTNERVFAHIQNTPFSYRTQNVEAEHIEDCSYRQNGPIQAMLNFGTIRLSTVGDEQTYRFTFVARPAEQFKIINKVIQIVDEDSPTKYNL